MSAKSPPPHPTAPSGSRTERRVEPRAESTCPVCGAPLVQEKCKVVCRSERCVYRIVFNCSEF